MSTPADLTRWNRAGLRRFQYVDGNAATYLELLREALAARFEAWGGSRVHLPGAVIAREASDFQAKRERMLAQYDDARRDFAWEIARSFARACHVLTGHIDAFANEGYLETATQWDLLRRLVEMLGYTPAPPASASTVLVLGAKANASGLVARGLQVKYSPPAGAAPVLFETLDDLNVDPALNELRLARWDRSEQSFDPFAGGAGNAASPWHASESMKLSAGQWAVLIQEPPANGGGPSVTPDVQAVRVGDVDATTSTVHVVMAGIGSETTTIGNAHWLRGFTRLLAGPKKTYRAELNGPRLTRLDRAHGLAAGDLVAWRASNVWNFDVVTAANELAFTNASASQTPRGAIYRAVLVPPVVNTKATPAALEFRVPLHVVAAAYVDGPGAPNPLPLSEFETRQGDDEKGYLVLKPSIGAAAIHVVLGGAPAIGQVASTPVSADTYRFKGTPGTLKSGAWVVAEYRDGASLVHRPARVATVEEHEDDFQLVLESMEEAFVAPLDADALETLIGTLRRAEAVLDQPVWNRLRLEELANGAIGERQVSSIAGVGALGSKPPSYADKLAAEGVESVADLARFPAQQSVAGIPSSLLRAFRTRAEQLIELPTKLGAVSSLLAARVAALVALEKGKAQPQASEPLPLERLYGPFQHALVPEGHDRNQTGVGDPPYELARSAAELPPALKPGRFVVVARDDEAVTHEALVEEVTQNRVLLVPSLPRDAGFTLGNTIFYVNAVRAGHGEAKPQRLLGSGNAALPNQEFVMDVAGIAFVADSTMPTGVRADIEIRVDVHIWQQVASLRDSRPADPHYTVRVTEQGFLRIAFGDGENGRRLPTGVNNVRVRYRIGNGLSGNLAAGSLTKLVKPHALVGSVRQPVPAAGGNDMESVASLRESAPASLLALERAVSLSDYADLATSQSSIWQARAFARSAGLGRRGNVEVVIVPAGGAPLDADLEPVVSEDFLGREREFLRRHAPPGVAIVVRPFEPILLDLSVTVRVRFAEYDPAAVVDRVEAALWSSFGLERRRLGQALQRSEVYGVVEDVVGVENSDCAIHLLAGSQLVSRPLRVVGARGLAATGRGDVIQTIVPRERQLVYLDRSRSTVKVTAVEYEL